MVAPQPLLSYSPFFCAESAAKILRFKEKYQNGDLLADYLDVDSSVSWAVEFAEVNSLPGAEFHFA